MVLVDWYTLLNLLEIDNNKRSLPVQTACPLCRKTQLLIFPDELTPGQWYYCRNCRSTGDLVQLASRTWQLSIDQTIAKLLENNAATLPNDPRALAENDHVDRPISNYKKTAKILAAYNDMVDDSARHLAGSADLTRLLNKLYINPRVTKEALIAGFGNVVGGTSAKKIGDALSGTRIKPANLIPFIPTKSNDGNNEEYPIQVNRQNYSRLPKRHRGDLLMIPFYSCPGRLCMMRYIDKQADPRLDFIDQPIASFRHGRSARNKENSVFSPDYPDLEGGITFNRRLLDNKQNVIVAIEDLMVYLRMQASHHGRGVITPLPIVHYYDSVKRYASRSWSIFDGAKKIFWCCKLTPSVLFQAIRTDGYIVYTDIDDKTETGIRQFIQSKIPTQLISEFENRAVPWPVALEAWAENKSDNELENLLRSVATRRDDATQFVCHCSKQFQRRCRRLVDVKNHSLHIQLRGQHIMDSNEGWKVAVSASHSVFHVISEARLAIDKAIAIPNKNDSMYYGRILYKDYSIPFVEPASYISHDPLLWMHNRVVAAGLGVPTYDKRWNVAVMQMAMMFRTPIVGDGLDCVGWDDDSNSFEFPKISIKASGRVTKQHKLLLSDSFPGAVFSEPTTLTPNNLDGILSDNETNRTFWTLFVATVTSALRPMFGYANRNVAVIVENSGKAAGVSARCCGCATVNSLRDVDMARVVSLAGIHRWPTAIGLESRPTKAHVARLLSEDVSEVPMMLGVNWWQSRWLVMTGWDAVRLSGESQLPLAQQKLACTLVPSYIVSLLSRQTALQSDDNAFIRMVTDDVAYWLESINADGSLLRAIKTENILTAETASETALGDIVFSMLSEEGVIIENSLDTASERDLVRIEKNIFIPQSLLIPLIKEKTELEVSASGITAAFKQSGVKVKPTTMQGKYGWLLNEQWLADVVKTRSSQTSPV